MSQQYQQQQQQQQQQHSYNGRVDIKTPSTHDLFKLYDKIPVNQCATFRNPTGGIWNETPLSIAFFSEENLAIIQNGIRAGVFARSNSQYMVGVQSCDTLKVIMRSVFLQKSTNVPNTERDQIIAMNNEVLDFCINNVYNEAQGYLKYLDDASSLSVPLAHPTNVNRNEKPIEFKSWF